MNLSFQELIQELAKLTQQQLYCGFAGAGFRLHAELGKFEGLSNFFLGSTICYSEQSFQSFTAITSNQSYVSKESAVLLASSALYRAQEYAPTQSILGLGITGALKTKRALKGGERVYIAVRGAFYAHCLKISFNNQNASRSKELQDSITSYAGIAYLLFKITGVTRYFEEVQQLGREIDMIESISELELKEKSLTELVLKCSHSLASSPIYLPVQRNQVNSTQVIAKNSCIYPGSFNPDHFGHFAIMNFAKQFLAKSVIPEISVKNFDSAKDVSDIDLLLSRVCNLSGRELILSSCALFIDKVNLYKSDFLLGADIFLRLHDEHVNKLAQDLKRFNLTLYVFTRTGSEFTAGFFEQSPLRLVSKLIPLVKQISSSHIRASNFNKDIL
jgi:nicotinamide mononucleotide (NMN) deamidase PncC